MSKRVNGQVIIEEEEPDVCELCGKFDELRPYGQNGERICYECGMKNEELTTKMCAKVLFGVKEH